jgi:hypothetical protein
MLREPERLFRHQQAVTLVRDGRDSGHFPSEKNSKYALYYMKRANDAGLTAGQSGGVREALAE